MENEAVCRLISIKDDLVLVKVNLATHGRTGRNFITSVVQKITYFKNEETEKLCRLRHIALHGR